MQVFTCSRFNHQRVDTIYVLRLMYHDLNFMQQITINDNK